MKNFVAFSEATKERRRALDAVTSRECDLAFLCRPLTKNTLARPSAGPFFNFSKANRPRGAAMHVEAYREKFASAVRIVQ